MEKMNEWGKKLTWMTSFWEMSFAAILLSIIAGNEVSKLEVELKDGKTVYKLWGWEVCHLFTYNKNKTQECAYK
jgi:hypothetical protein